LKLLAIDVFTCVPILPGTPVTGCFSLSRASWYATSLSHVFVLCSAALASLISSLVIGDSLSRAGEAGIRAACPRKPCLCAVVHSQIGNDPAIKSFEGASFDSRCGFRDGAMRLRRQNGIQEESSIT